MWRKSGGNGNASFVEYLCLLINATIHVTNYDDTDDYDDISSTKPTNFESSNMVRSVDLVLIEFA